MPDTLTASPCLQATPAVANVAVTQLLRDTLDWQGLIMCDADAITQQVLERHTQPNLTAAAAAGTGIARLVISDGTTCWLYPMGRLVTPLLFPLLAALLAGTDLELNAVPIYAYDKAPEAVRAGLVAESYLDVAVANALTLRTRLGLFDPPTLVPYNLITNDTVLSPAHVALCRELAANATVLLQVCAITAGIKVHHEGPPLAPRAERQGRAPSAPGRVSKSRAAGTGNR